MRIAGERIKTARERCGLTQRAVARAIDTTEFRVSKWERSLAQPNAVYLLKLAQALNVDPRELADSEGGDQ
ncbi:helix-turn-helix domain-containing protein [Nocardiopsis sp. LOL_012]|uniref:helix-turn-helix domain-containing protein n=1 Tax=Nocardiopsis sp. LOL_012 TaxID=3345409 RepID=UPI003A85BEF6